MGTRFLVVQHAEKEAVPGDPGLSARGIAQAEAAAARLSEFEIAAIYSSRLARARQTAERFASRLGLPVVVDDRLTERMNWTGDESLDDFRAEWARSTVDRYHRPRSGDSSSAAGERLEEALLDLAGAHSNQAVVVVGHGGVTVDLARNLLGDQAVDALAPGVIHGGIPNCSITEIVAEADRLEIRALAEPASAFGR